MSGLSFTNTPLQKLLNKRNIFSRVDALEAKDEAPSLTAETLGEITPDAGDIYVTEITNVINNNVIGTPGGADTNVQYNDGGAFGGAAGLTWDKINSILQLIGYLVGTEADGLLLIGGDAVTADTPGGVLSLTGGKGKGSGEGATAGITGGQGGETGGGGAAGVYGGPGGATSGNGAPAQVMGGDATDGDGGNVELTVGTGAGSGVDGKILATGDTEITGKLSVSVPTGYAEMYMYNNATACAIDTVNVYHAIYNSFGNNDGTLAPLRDATHWTYKAGVAYAITAFADYNAPTSTITEVTTTGVHALLAGEPVTITGTTNYNGTYLVLAVTATTKFTITKAYAGNDATGNVRRPATMKCLVAGYYRASFNFSGICASTNDVFKWELNKDITPLDNIVARSIWTSGVNNYRSVSANGLAALTAGQYVWASVKNYSGTGDLTFNSGNVVFHMIK